MQLTTREAVEDAIQCMSIYYEDENNIAAQREKTLHAAILLCEHYGLKLEQFFDVEDVV